MGTRRSNTSKYERNTKSSRSEIFGESKCEFEVEYGRRVETHISIHSRFRGEVGIRHAVTTTPTTARSVYGVWIHCYLLIMHNDAVDHRMYATAHLNLRRDGTCIGGDEKNGTH
jgi:hypothetical protein